MIKDEIVQKEVVVRHKFCDVCGVEIGVGLECHALTCQYCKKDLCYDHTGYIDRSTDDHNIVWCEECWKLGEPYRQEIDELHGKIDRLHVEWKRACGLEE